MMASMLEAVDRPIEFKKLLTDYITVRIDQFRQRITAVQLRLKEIEKQTLPVARTYGTMLIEDRSDRASPRQL